MVFILETQKTFKDKKIHDISKITISSFFQLISNVILTLRNKVAVSVQAVKLFHEHLLMPTIFTNIKISWHLASKSYFKQFIRGRIFSIFESNWSKLVLFALVFWISSRKNYCQSIISIIFHQTHWPNFLFDVLLML